MGRRSINTTKSGKYMNPTDQARKEARKRELKKNKKQRQLVRTAVLKGKDPLQILAELQKIDEMQYNALTPPPLSEKVLKDKRKKLHDTWNRLKGLYYREDPEKLKDLRRMEADYISNRDQVIKYFESVKVAQNVQLDDIPLPAMPSALPEGGGGGFISTPQGQIIAPPSILKKVPIPVSFTTKDTDLKSKTPGVPPGPPPPLSDDEDTDGEFIRPTALQKNQEEEDKKNRKRTIRFADEERSSKSAKTVGPDINEFLKEVEAVQKQAAPIPQTREIPLPPPMSSHLDMPLGMDEQSVAPPPLMFRPPPMLSMPPPHPPMRHMIRPPPRLLRPPIIQAPPMGPRPSNTNTMPPPPPPGSIKAPKFPPEDKHSATIEAKPQLRSLNAELMRFLPTTLRVKREDKSRKHPNKPDSEQPSAPGSSGSSKDDPYQLFLKEMESFL